MATVSLLLLVLAAGAFLQPSSCDEATLALHQFTLQELQAPGDDVMQRIRDAVFNVGVFAVTQSMQEQGSSTSIPGTLLEFVRCAQQGHMDGQMREVQLKDLTYRKTLATATNHSTAFPLPGIIEANCPVFAESSKVLRSAVEATGQAYAAVLDQLLYRSMRTAPMQEPITQPRHQYMAVKEDKLQAARMAAGTITPGASKASSTTSTTTTSEATPSHPFLSAVKRAESLEHFHLFYRTDPPPKDTPTLQMHSDMGLFIVMTPAEYFEVTQGAQHLPRDGISSRSRAHAQRQQQQQQQRRRISTGLVLELPDGRLVRPVFPENCLLVLNGEGATRWMPRPTTHPPHNSRTAATAAAATSTTAAAEPEEYEDPEEGSVLEEEGHGPYSPAHEVLVPEAEGVVRAWFGRMYLPTRDARLRVPGPHGPPNMTFNEYRQQTYGAFKSQQAHTASTAGCSPLRRKLADEESCGADEVYCWMSCMKIPSKLTCGKANILCENPQGKIWPDEFINPSTGKPDHCLDCQLECKGPDPVPPAPPRPPPRPASSQEFCNTDLTPITMWMTGFQTTAKAGTACVAFLFGQWALTSQVKFAFACIGTVLMGVTVAALAFGRRMLLQRRRALRQPALASMSDIAVKDPGPGKAGAMALLALLYGVQMTLAYALMLIAMTYQVELFIMVVVGLVVGYVLFNAWHELDEADRQANSSSSSGNVPTVRLALDKDSDSGNGDPCCAV
mmetsp:Transcript_25463/g.55353  ORF Transcript_25463/g.55353 Transcript_25463/m.55353 type:complete len:730 (-) Transcript_25463:789-2978(-)